MSEAELERMVAYLQEYVGRYSLKSVWDQLLREGHDPALINRAIVEYDRRLAAGPTPLTPSEGAPEEAPEEVSISHPHPGPPEQPKRSLGARILLVAGGVGFGILILALIIVALIILVAGGLCVLYGKLMNPPH